jgi:acetyl esterase/lipase
MKPISQVINNRILHLLITAVVSASSQLCAQGLSGQIESPQQALSDIPYLNKTQPGFDEYAAERCKLDIYVPADADHAPTVVWFHGGGLRSGQKHIPERLKGQGMIIVAPNYRMFPKIKSPVYIQDAGAAVAWVFKHIDKYGGDPELIYISGHSAGGYLASMVGLDKQWLKAHSIDANSIAGLIPFSGHTITHFTVREERGIAGEQPIIDALAPLYHVRADAPPLVLITGDRELELLGRYEENAYMMRMMKVAGHKATTLYELQGYGHGMTEPAFPILIRQVQKLTKNKQK